MTFEAPGVGIGALERKTDPSLSYQHRNASKRPGAGDHDFDKVVATCIPCLGALGEAVQEPSGSVLSFKCSNSNTRCLEGHVGNSLHTRAGADLEGDPRFAHQWSPRNRRLALARVLPGKKVDPT